MSQTEVSSIAGWRRRHTVDARRAGGVPGNRGLRRRHLTYRGEADIPTVDLPDGLSEREATLLLDALARLKARRFGRLTVVVSDGRVVDVEVSEKMDHDVLRKVSM